MAVELRVESTLAAIPTPIMAMASSHDSAAIVTRSIPSTGAPRARSDQSGNTEAAAHRTGHRGSASEEYPQVHLGGTHRMRQQEGERPSFTLAGQPRAPIVRPMSGSTNCTSATSDDAVRPNPTKPTVSVSDTASELIAPARARSWPRTSTTTDRRERCGVLLFARMRTIRNSGRSLPRSRLSACPP